MGAVRRHRHRTRAAAAIHRGFLRVAGRRIDQLLIGRCQRLVDIADSHGDRLCRAQQAVTDAHSHVVDIVGAGINRYLVVRGQDETQHAGCRIDREPGGIRPAATCCGNDGIGQRLRGQIHIGSGHLRHIACVFWYRHTGTGARAIARDDGRIVDRSHRDHQTLGERVNAAIGDSAAVLHDPCQIGTAIGVSYCLVLEPLQAGQCQGSVNDDRRRAIGHPQRDTWRDGRDLVGQRLTQLVVTTTWAIDQTAQSDRHGRAVGTVLKDVDGHR